MVRKLLIAFLFYFINSSFYAQLSQEQDYEAKVFFSEQIRGHYKTHIKKIEQIENAGRYEEAEALAKKFIQEYMVGSYMDNFSLKCLKSGQCYIDDYKKPMLILSYASWSIPTKGEVKAFNNLAKNFHKQIDFVVLYWDSKQDARKDSKKLNSKIEILYVDELTNRYSSTIKMLKHTFGIPTTFVVGSDKRVLHIQTNIQNPLHLDEEVAIENCKEVFENHIQLIMNYENKLTY
ncbi:MAG: redoxin domain-containing protein [Flavobacteriaceae bacterium]|nr:redoxin domain-containing protein [Flavobacteriaceae bacterium]